MEIGDLDGKLPKEAIESISSRNISTLTPPQELAVKEGLLSGKNFVIAAPTASGKTLIAEMPMIKSVLWDRKKAVYVAPMRALVSEKHTDFKGTYPYLKVAMSIGELDSLDDWLAGYDIILASTEKLDSLIRHGVGWLDDVGCIIFDEVHMLDDNGRGPTLEILITRLKRMCKNAQIVALSATVGNAKEIAQWLGAVLVESDYRPVQLKKGIAFDGTAHYEQEEEELHGSSKIPEIRIAEDTLERKKQILVFYSTKKNTEAGAERLSASVERYLTAEERIGLQEASAAILGALGKPTSQCEKLARLVEKGTAFHHSGLVNAQRHAVEEAFRRGYLKAICSTTTLGLGVNLPAHTVLVRDTSRYRQGEGSERLSVNEVTQLFGRAGRPKYDKEGRALLIARSKSEIGELYNRYMNGELEPVESKLGVMPVLRTHVLAFISTRFLTTEESINNFMSETLYGYQYSNIGELKGITAEVLDELAQWGFVERNGSVYDATRIGRRVSELYIDPLSAKWIIDSLHRERDELGNLFVICNTIEMRPYVRAAKEAGVAFMRYQYLLANSDVNYESQDLMYYDPLKPMSTAMMLNDWIEEKGEREITKDYSTTPGALFAKITNADWLLYSSTELGKLIRVSTARLLELRVRLKYGIKKELADLVRLEQVGRVRARLMYDNGIRSVADLRREDCAAKVETLFGKEIAGRILDQVK